MPETRRRGRGLVPAIVLWSLAPSFSFVACGRSTQVSSNPDASLDGGASPDASPTQSTFYVAPGGSDDAPGDFEHPFATLTRARQAVRGALRGAHGEIAVVLRGGVHRLAAPLLLGPEDSGSAAGAVVFRAWQDERPIISGGQPIGGWQPAPGMTGVWTAPAGAARSRQLFVNGARAVRATGPSPVTLNQVQDGYDASAATLAGWRRPTDLELVWELGAGPWASPRCPVRVVNNAHIAVAEPCWHNTSQRNAGGAPSISGPPTRLENAIELLDEPGEFYLDQTAGAVYYRPRPGDDMQTATAVVPVLEALVIIGGDAAGPAHDIRFEGIQFSHTTWLGPASDDGFSEAQANFHMKGPGTPAGSYNQGGCDLSTPMGTCPYGAWSKVPGAVIVTRAQSIRFRRDVFARLGGVGLDVERGSADVTVEGCVFTDTSANAVQVGDIDIEDAASPDVTHDVTFSNNWIHHTPVEYLGGVGVFVGHTRDVTVQHSRIDHTPYSGLSAGWGWADTSFPRTLANPARRTKILFNRVFAHNLVNQDGDAIYLNSVQGTSYDDGALVEGNLLFDDSMLIDGGLYTDNGSRFLTLRGNIVNGWHGCHPIGDMIFDDNDVWVVSVPQWRCLPAGAPAPPVTLTNNRIVPSLDKVAPERIERAGLTADFADLLNVIPL